MRYDSCYLNLPQNGSLPRGGGLGWGQGQIPKNVCLCLVWKEVYYLMQGFVGTKKLVGLVFVLGLMQVGTPLAQSLAPLLYGDDNLNGVFAFQAALALACTACLFALPLPPGITVRKSFTLVDALSFILFASGIALLCAFLVQGRTVWWTTQWLGWLLAGGVGLTGTLGISGAQMTTFYLIVAGASLLGAAASLVLLDINDIRRPVMIALACFALGAWLDIGVGMQTRPAQLYLSQTIIAFATLLFMGPMMLEGALRALAKSPDHMMSFSAVFGLSQTLGGLAGAAAFSAFLTYRTRDHLAAIAQNLTLSNPALAADIQRNAAALSATLSDPVLLQGRAVSQITAQAGKEAAVAAYSDLFALLAAMAAVSTLVAVALWLYRRHYKIDILAAEKAKVFAALGR